MLRIVHFKRGLDLMEWNCGPRNLDDSETSIFPNGDGRYTVPKSVNRLEITSNEAFSWLQEL